jgi:hypothetical protein
MNETNARTSEPGPGEAAKGSRLTRRDVLRALGFGGAGLAAAGFASFGVATTAAQDLGLVATPETASPPAFDRVGPKVGDKAADLRYDLNAIFRFVADEVDYDPYVGALRGASGTYWGLAGNSVDQAILLAALLDEALIETRFVVGELSDEAADRMMDSARQDEATARAKAARVLAPLPAADGQTLALTPEEESLANALPAAQRDFMERIDRQLEEEIEVVADALASAGISLPEPAFAMPEHERRRHVWVQYADGPLWIDLDPSIPGSQPGDVHATVVETHDRLPADEHHRVTIRLVAEQVVGGAPTRSELLSFEATSGELVGVPITLLHPEAGSLQAAGVAITAALTGSLNYVPALIVGDQSVQGKPVTFATGGGVLGALSVDSDADGATEGDTLGEWLEIDLKTPQGERRIVREIFDRGGYAQRQVTTVELAAVAPVELVEAGEAAGSFLPLTAVWSIGVVSGMVPDAYFREAPQSGDQLADLSRIVHTYHYGRDVVSQSRAPTTGYRAFRDEPNVTAFVMAKTATAGAVTETATFDILHRRSAVKPLADGSGQVDTNPLLTEGVLAHVIERAMVEVGAVMPAELALPPGSSTGVGRVFEEADRQGIGTVVLQPGEADPTRLDIGEGARIRIAEALTAGFVVVVPERPVALSGEERVGWWLVDPTAGATEDQMDDGRGVEMGEYARLLGFALCTASMTFAGFAAYQIFAAAAEYAQGEDASGRVQAAKALTGLSGMSLGGCGGLLI